jgi:hypothetical protein
LFVPFPFPEFAFTVVVFVGLSLLQRSARRRPLLLSVV